MILFREFEERNHFYTLKSLSSQNFQIERIRRYKSPVVLSFSLQIAEKFEAILAVDQAMAITKTF